MTTNEELREHPILFSTEMVRAILEGRKTMTRRICKLEGLEDSPWYETRDGDLVDRITLCPYGQVGDRLFVKETWYSTPDKKELLGYVADGDIPHGQAYRIRPSIFMFRKFSRITLGITELRVERVQEITEEDAKAEGTTPSIVGSDREYLKYRAGFMTLWDKLNAKRGYSWESNCWVWVVSFKVVNNDNK